MKELVTKLEQRLGLPEERVKSILGSTIRYIELHYPQYITLMEQVIFVPREKEKEEINE